MSDDIQRFTGRAADYERFRERYDADILLPRFRTWCGLTPQWIIADIGAGYGYARRYLQLLVGLLDSLSDAMGRPEIKWGALDVAKFSGRNQALVHGKKRLATIRTSWFRTFPDPSPAILK